MQGHAPSLQQAVAAPGRVSSFPTLTNNASASRNKHGRPLPSGLAQPCPHLWQEVVWLWLRVDPTTHARSPLSGQKSSGVTQLIQFLNKNCGSHLSSHHCFSLESFAATIFPCFGTSSTQSTFLMMVLSQVPVTHLPSLGTIS